MKILATIALLSALIFQTPCAQVQLTLGSATVQQGGTQSITTQVTNCDTKKMKLGLTISVTDAVGGFTLVRNTIQNYDPNQLVTFNDSYAVPANAPTGTYRVIAIVHDNSPQGGGAEITRAVQEFQVTP